MLKTIITSGRVQKQPGSIFKFHAGTESVENEHEFEKLGFYFVNLQ